MAFCHYITLPSSISFPSLEDLPGNTAQTLSFLVFFVGLMQGPPISSQHRSLVLSPDPPMSAGPTTAMMLAREFATEESSVGATTEVMGENQEVNDRENSELSLELSLSRDETNSSYSDKSRKEPIFFDFFPTLKEDHVQVGEIDFFPTRSQHQPEEVSLELRLGCATCITKKKKSTERSSSVRRPSGAGGIKRMRGAIKREESQHGVSMEMNLCSDPWVIKKVMETSDIGHLARLLLAVDWVRKHVLPSWDAEHVEQIRNGVRVSVWDCDTKSEHQLLFKQWSSGSYVLIDSWTREFVKRRDLNRGDMIGLYWDQNSSRFNFSILKRAVSD